MAEDFEFAPDQDETADEGWSLDFEPDEEQVDTPASEGDAPEPDEKEELRKKYEQTQLEAAELRGKLAAYSERPTPTPQQPAATQPQADPNAGMAALRSKLRDVGAKMYDPDRQDEGLEEFLGITAQIAAVQAKQIAEQYAGNAVSTASDMIIESFLNKKEKKDELYDEVGPRFEEELKKYDRKIVAGMSRDQLIPALEAVYKAAKADVLEEKYTAAKARKAAAKTKALGQAPNMGGGKGSAAGNKGPAPRLNDKTRAFALKAGLSEDDLADLFTSKAKDDEDEW